MSYFHASNKAQEFGAQSLAKIQEFGILPTPENYELWFVYVSGSNADLTKAIDALLKKNKKLTNEQCYHIFQEFLGTNREEETVKHAGTKIQKTIEDVNSAVSVTKKHTEDYSHNLEKITEQLQGDHPPAELSTLLNGVLSDTKAMIGHNQHLETMLKSSVQVVDEMRRDLEIARKEALTDALTGVSNRKAFDQEIYRLVEASNSEEGSVFSLILLDIDFFKKFNDTFGHQVGDQVLKLVAKTLKDGVKGRDIVVRYGGEEFAILLPETNIEGGEKVADILRRDVSQKEVVNRTTGEKIAKITLSAGVSQYIRGENVTDMIERVDSALYDAKKRGRNRVVASAGILDKAIGS